MRQKLIIGITGRKRSGKDEICKELIRLAQLDGLKAERIGFADALKEEVSKAVGLPIEAIEERKHLFRPLLQWWGTDFKRALAGNDYWVEILGVKIRKSDANVIIVPDIRFENEAHFVSMRNGYIIKVERNQDGPLDSHPSEAGISDFFINSTIENNESLIELKDKIYGIYATQLQKML